MISLDVEHSCLLELIKASLFNVVPVIPDDVNWEKLYDLANYQCIVPLIASFVPEDSKRKWLDSLYQSKAHYMQLLYEQDALCRLFNSNNIPFFVFKGTSAAIYYPIPSYRTFGDIDFFVAEESIESAKSILENNGYRFIENNDRHYEYEKNGICFELHNRISRLNDCDIDHIVLNDMNSLVERSLNNYSFPCLSTYSNGLILLWHLMHHLKYSGIGFRQIIDWMMFVYKELDDSSWHEYFQQLANEAGFEKLAKTVTYMCKKWLGLSDLITWCNGADEELADQLLSRVFYDGNFGGERALSDSIKLAVKKEGFLKFLQRSGMAHWSLAQKHAIFRPFAWLYQLCRFGSKGIFRLFNGKKVFVKDKHSVSLEELWERLE